MQSLRAQTGEPRFMKDLDLKKNKNNNFSGTPLADSSFYCAA
jgi:hypothetical protein